MTTQPARPGRHHAVRVGVAITALVGLILSLFALVTPNLSYAEGGASIATAPTVTPGRQEFGNLVNGVAVPNGCSGEITHNQWWLLSITVGDHVVIDWEEPVEIATDHAGIAVYPVGTTDFNYPHTSSVLVQHLNSNAKNEATFVATRSGNMPMLIASAIENCFAGIPGPYSFTESVTHALNVAPPRVRRVAHHGHVTVAVHNPEGGPISSPLLRVALQVQRPNGSWHSVGTAAVTHSAAHIRYTIPRRLLTKAVMLRATAHGAGYLTTSSRSIKVRVRSLHVL